MLKVVKIMKIMVVIFMKIVKIKNYALNVMKKVIQYKIMFVLKKSKSFLEALWLVL